MLPLLLVCQTLHADIFPREDIILDPAPGLFSVCHGNGCTNLSFVSLSPEQWREVTDAFRPPAAMPADEREQLRRAIALMETFVGAVTGTWRDKGGTFNFDEGQMDCIDESTNTTLYMTMFAKHGLMRWHRVEDRATRGLFNLRWPHTTAVVREARDGEGRFWAVDSWFLDNGLPPFVVPLDEWRSGWQPQLESSPEGGTVQCSPGRQE